MKVCPKCKTEYSDSDFRTICSSCMTTLVKAEGAAAQGEVTQAGPISVGMPSPGIGTSIQTISIAPVTISMPEVSMPTLPDIPMPERQPEEPHPAPGPIPPPQRPQPGPEPAPPQPPIIPTPQPVPVPVPVPQPAPRHVPTPEPTEPASEHIQYRPMTAAELSSGQAQAGTTGFFAVVCGVVTLLFFYAGFLRSVNVATLALLAALTGLTIYLARQSLYRSIIHHAELKLPRACYPGVQAPIAVAIGMQAQVEITEAELTITAEERSVRRGSKSSTTYRQQLYSQKLPLSLPRILPGGQAILLRETLPIPPQAVPSFSGRNNYIEWKASLWVGIPGKYPDIRKTMPVTVLPLRPAPLPPLRTVQVLLPALEDLHAELRVNCPSGDGKALVLPLGADIPIQLAVQPGPAAGKGRVWVEASYRIHATGDDETACVVRLPFFAEGWQEGVRQEERATLHIPAQSPVSYVGTHLQVDWTLTVRQEIAWGVDKRQVVEAIVIPGELRQE